jgi:hypothetical protein
MLETLGKPDPPFMLVVGKAGLMSMDETANLPLLKISEQKLVSFLPD